MTRLNFSINVSNYHLILAFNCQFNALCLAAIGVAFTTNFCERAFNGNVCLANDCKNFQGCFELQKHKKLTSNGQCVIRLPSIETDMLGSPFILLVPSFSKKFQPILEKQHRLATTERY